MLTLTCRWRAQGHGAPMSGRVSGRVWNCSGLAASSDYEWLFEGRVPLAGSARLEGYPRWSESSRGLAARCLAQSRPNDLAPSMGAVVPDNWDQLSVEIALASRLRSPKLLALATALRTPEAGVLAMGWQDRVGAQDFAGFVAEVPARAQYQDAWALAEHTLRVGMWGCDEVRPVPALNVPTHSSEGCPSYVLARELPEPARSAFEARMAHSTRLLIAGEGTAYYAWDWNEFLQGGR